MVEPHTTNGHLENPSVRYEPKDASLPWILGIGVASIIVAVILHGVLLWFLFRREAYLEPGEATVGTMISMHHVSATVPGTALLAEARATVINGRSVHFSVVVTREDGEIAAAGEHALRIIDLARFHDRLAGAGGAKAARFPEPAVLAHDRMPDAIAA